MRGNLCVWVCLYRKQEVKSLADGGVSEQTSSSVVSLSALPDNTHMLSVPSWREVNSKLSKTDVSSPSSSPPLSAEAGFPLFTTCRIREWLSHTPFSFLRIFVFHHTYWTHTLNTHSEHTLCDHKDEQGNPRLASVSTHPDHCKITETNWRNRSHVYAKKGLTRLSGLSTRGPRWASNVSTVTTSDLWHQTNSNVFTMMETADTQQPANRWAGFDWHHHTVMTVVNTWLQTGRLPAVPCWMRTGGSHLCLCVTSCVRRWNWFHRQQEASDFNRNMSELMWNKHSV